MKKKFCYTLSTLLFATSLFAQDIYKMEMMSSGDLNGTARFVSMGGAMSALGADISVMGTNPAGIALYRRSDIALTGSATTQPNGEDFLDIGKSRGSFDQIGFVYSAKLGDSGAKFFNVGFNYNKRKNFKNYIGVNNVKTDGMSQSWEMMDLAYTNGWLDLSNEQDREYTTPLACLGYDTYMIDPTYDNEGKITGYTPVDADHYNYKRVQWGGIQQYDFNLSFNWQDQIYVGLTAGVYNVDFHSATDYGEALLDDQGGLHDYYMQSDEELTGNGYDIKLGVILRPIETSPFRIGFAVHSPTFYDLTSYSTLYMNSPFRSVTEDGIELPYTDGHYTQTTPNDYKIRTPWKINLSAATTVGNWLAIGAEYEFYNPAKAKVSYPNGDDYYYDSWNQGDKDYALSEEAKRFLKPVNTFRIGAEAKIAKGIYGRLGYNFVSAPYKKEAYHNLFTASSSYYFSTNTDYVNLGAINRLTAGLGWRGKHFYADATYQFQQQQGDLYAFHVPVGQGSEQNALQAKTVDLNRHNFMFTVGYKF